MTKISNEMRKERSNKVTSPINILLVHPIAYPLYAAQLANALAKKGNQVTVMVPKYFYVKGYFNSDINVIPLNTSQSYFDMLLKTINPFTYLKIYNLINDVNPDIIHITWDLVWFNILAPVLRKKYPLIVTDHEPIAKNTEISFYGKYVNRATRILTMNMSDALIVHSEKFKKYLLQKGVEKNRIFVVPHGIFTYYNKWCGKKIEEESAILFFGLIGEYKGIEYLIKAQPSITISIPDAKIIIAGKGDFSKYEKLIKDKSYFEVVNEYIPDEEVATFFQRASIVVLPYTDASQSGVLTIAYSFGKPVVVTDVGGLPEYVDNGETGIIVPPADSKSLSEAIIKLLEDNNLRREMTLNIDKKIKNELSWEKVADMTEKIYHNVIKRRHLR